MSELIKIIEKKPIPSGAVLIAGLPDVGLVGVIATSHIISQLKLEEVAYIDSTLLPPIAVLHDGLPHSPLRIFGNGDLLAVISETAIPADVVYPLARTLVNWCKKKNVKMIISLGGLSTPNRQNIEEPKVFAAASSQKLLETIKDSGVEVLGRGFMVGPYALILRYAMESSINALLLMAEAFHNYPDPEAAAAVVMKLRKIINLNIDVSALIEQGEEIRLRARDIMRRTQEEMAKMKKSQEYDLPLYV